MTDKLTLGDPKSGLASLVRPHFTEGLLLQDDDLTAGVSYTRELSRLMFRTILGCGVLCGLKVDQPTLECGKLKINVARGVALGCLGDPIELLRDQQVDLDICKVTLGTELWIGLRPIEKCCAPRTVACSLDDEATSVCTRERDGFELRVFSARPPCSCGCAPLAKAVAAPTAGGNPKPAAAKAAPAARKGQAASAAASAPAAASAAPGKDTGCCGDSTKLADPDPSPEPTGPAWFNTRTTAGEGCYGPFYAGDCACDCDACEWIVLARATRADTQATTWDVDHSVRRFVRPVLMRDPVVAAERAASSGT